MIYGAVRENSSKYQLPQVLLALWPELKADVWIMSPEHLAGFPGPEKMIETSVSLCESQMYQISSVGRKHRPWRAALQTCLRMQGPTLELTMVAAPGKPPLSSASIWMDSQGSRFPGPR